MTLNLLQFEDRSTPAVWYGGEVWVGVRSERVFEDWHGEVNTFDAGNLRYAAPGPGGGPRVAVFDLGRGVRDRPDFFAGDPASRAGVVLVGTDPPAPVHVPGVPPLSAGDPAGFPLYLDFEGDDGEAWVREAFAEAARLLAPAGLYLTTTRPDAPAGSYGSVVFGAPLTFHGGAVLGLAPADRWDAPAINPWQSRSVFVSLLAGSPSLAGAAAAHEVGHAFGLTHRAGRSVMSAAVDADADWHPDDLWTLRARAAAARRTG